MINPDKLELDLVIGTKNNYMNYIFSLMVLFVYAGQIEASALGWDCLIRFVYPEGNMNVWTKIRRPNQSKPRMLTLPWRLYHFLEIHLLKAKHFLRSQPTFPASGP